MKKLQAQDVGELIKIFEGMNAKKAAEKLSVFDDAICQILIQKMSKKKAAQILENLDAKKVRNIVSNIAQQT